MVLPQEEDIVVCACVLIIVSALQLMRQRRKHRSCWTRPWIARRRTYGAYHALVKELSDEDPYDLRNFIRMDRADFDELLGKVSPFIKRQNTHMRESISPAERLSLTLHVLATGHSYQSLESLYRIPVCTLSTIIPETFCLQTFLCLKHVLDM